MKKLLLIAFALISMLNVNAAVTDNLFATVAENPYILNGEGGEGNYYSFNEKVAFIAKLDEEKTFDRVDLVFRNATADSKVKVYVGNDLSEFYNEETKTILEPETADAEAGLGGFITENTARYKVVQFDKAKTGQYLLVWFTDRSNNVYELLPTGTKLYKGNKYVQRKYTVEGVLNAETLAQYANLPEATLIDFTNADFSNITTPLNIELANPNTLIIIPEDQRDNIANTYNVVKYFDNPAWLTALSKITVDDSYDFFISGDGINHTNTGSYGYSFTRTIKAGAVVTFASVANIAEIPSGLKAYTISTANNNEVTFEGANSIAEKTPYLIANTTDNDIEISYTGADNFTLVDAATNTTNVGNVNFIVATTLTAGSDNAYGLKNAEYGQEVALKQINGMIKPGRCYFEITDLATRTIRFNDIATGINANAAIDAEGNVNIYTINGVKVNANQLKAGAYIIGGRKVVVK